MAKGGGGSGQVKVGHPAAWAAVAVEVHPAPLAQAATGRVPPAIHPGQDEAIHDPGHLEKPHFQNFRVTKSINYEAIFAKR